MTRFAIDRDDVDVASADGSVVHIRDLGPGDEAALRQLHTDISDRSLYLRFFSNSRSTALHFVPYLAAPPGRDHRALGAFSGQTLLGVADFERTGPQTAEFAVLVSDSRHHAGIGTLLIEHLIAAARGAGIVRFVADVLAENAAMLTVMRDLGFATTSTLDAGVLHVEMSLDDTADVAAAIAKRERSAGLASLLPLTAPRSIAVIGAGRRVDSVGSAILRNILDAGFAGPVFAVNPAGAMCCGIAGVRSVAELAEPPDLAIIAVPAQHVIQVVGECGRAGVRAALVVTAGFAEAGEKGRAMQAELVAVARNYGMRVVGPNCVGVLNNDPSVNLDATFARLPRRPGSVAVLAQSGAFGIGMVAAADTLGLGIAQFVSMGNKADVGGNDVLLAWQDDPHVGVICMYLESVGDPLRFARIARSVSAVKPLIAIKSGTTEAGRRAGASHTAAAASPDTAINALFEAAGVLRVDTMPQMLDLARVLVDQPLPRGPRVAIIGNSGGPEILAADAASRAGLQVVEFDAATQDRLTRMGVPPSNPLDLGAGVTPEAVGMVLDVVLSSSYVDMVMTVFTDVAITDSDQIRAQIGAAAASSQLPVVTVEIGALPGTTLGVSTDRPLPRFEFPEAAASALGHAHRYARMRSRGATAAVRPANLDVAAARALVSERLALQRAWLDADDVLALLAAYGVPLCPTRTATSADAAAHIARELGYPVVAKLADAGLHKTDVGGVRLNLADEAALRAAVAELLAMSAAAEPAVVVQPMLTGATELIIGAVHDPQFGPLIMLGAGGVLTDILEDRTFRMAPLAPDDAEAMLSSLRSARLLEGYRGAPVVAHSAVTDVLVRIAWLAYDIPEIAELDINPLVCRAEGALVVDARVRVAPAPQHPDPLVRQLRPASVTSEPG